jgi:hypothetical protein
LPNPFKKEEPKIDINLEKCEGHFGCFEKGCGKVIGFALYNEGAEMLFFTCPDGHKNEVHIAL